jgi:PAS domain S-box-containing protein
MTFAHTGRARGGVARAGRTPGRGGAATHVLIVDDDQNTSAALGGLLREAGFVASTAPDGGVALAEARRALPDVVLADLQMEPIDGVELCKRLHEIDSDLPVIIMTAFSDMQSIIESLRERAEDYLLKPLNFDVLLWSIERALARRDAKLEHETLRRALTERLVVSSVREQEYAEVEARQRAQLNALLENLEEGVTIADQSGCVLLINGAARAILGIEGEGPRTTEALHALGALDLEGRPLRGEQRPLMRALRGERFVDYQVLRVRPNGERRRVASTGTCVRDAQGNVALAIVVFRDVTELQRLEQQRDEYLALISHDLRSPLNSILMSAGMLKQSLAEKGLAGDAKLAARAEWNASRMATMLQDLTEATTLEAHGLALRREVCDLGALVAGVVDGMDDTRARRITIEVDAASPQIVLADAPRLERVVSNLLTNALKYSAEGAPVSVRLWRKGADVGLDVVDRGIGIAPESVKMLFDRYYRTTAGKARASGLGLGLYITRLIVEAHGGRVDVSSEVGKGSTFRLSLPSHAASA